MKRAVLSAAIFSVGLSGCTSPLVMPNPPAWQSKATNIKNWEEFAERSVDSIKGKMPELQPVYVNMGPYGVPFAPIFRNYLEEKLQDANYPVLQSPDGATTIVGFESHWVVYRKFGSKRLAEYFTVESGLAGVAAATRNISRTDTAIAAGAAIGPVADLLAALNGATDAEVALTTVVLTPNDNVIHRIKTQTFYIRPSDVRLYAGSPDQPPLTPAPALVSLPLAAEPR